MTSMARRASTSLISLLCEQQDSKWLFNFNRMKITYSLCLLPLLIITCAGNLCAQDYASQKEKIYLQTNHSFFSPGDAIYFKLYVVRAEDNKPTNISSVVYTELISPSGTLLQKAKYPVTDGYAEGSFDFNSDAPGGIYKLRAYYITNKKN